MIRNLCIFLIFVLCVVLMVMVAQKEHFQDDVRSVSPNAYKTMGEDDVDVARKPYLEFNDRFFLNALIDGKSTEVVQDANWKKINLDKSLEASGRERASQKIETILNSSLHPNDPELFHVVEMTINEIKQSPDGNAYVMTSDMLVHRIGKAYAASLSIKTYHDTKRTYNALINFELKGFIFEDKLGQVKAQNWWQDNNASLDNQTIMINKEDQEKLLCAQLRSIKEYRGLDYTSLSAEKMNCEG